MVDSKFTPVPTLAVGSLMLQATVRHDTTNLTNEK